MLTIYDVQILMIDLLHLKHHRPGCESQFYIATGYTVQPDNTSENANDQGLHAMQQP